MNATSAALAAAIAAAPSLTACADLDADCGEDLRAQTLTERATVALGPIALNAELADEPQERERGWRFRLCDLGAIALLPETESAMPITLCDVPVSLDLAFVRDGVVIALERDLAPCTARCSQCPVYGAGIVVDAVIEAPARTMGAVSIGDPAAIDLLL